MARVTITDPVLEFGGLRVTGGVSQRKRQPDQVPMGRPLGGPYFPPWVVWFRALVSEGQDAATRFDQVPFATSTVFEVEFVDDGLRIRFISRDYLGQWPCSCDIETGCVVVWSDLPNFGEWPADEMVSRLATEHRRAADQFDQTGEPFQAIEPFTPAPSGAKENP